jgi:molecular chaperone IbpA
MVMSNIDFSPLYRFAVGFDRMQKQLDAALSHADEQAASYPPYNIEVTGEDAYRITMAVAGFSQDDLELTAKDDTLLVAGKSRRDEREVHYLHRGIAGRSFERRFQLAEHIKVVGASLADGLLHIDLVREVPEEKKPRAIPIAAGARPKALEKKAA